MEIKQEVEGFRKEFEIFCAQFHENLIKCGKVATVMTLKQEEELTKYLLTPQDETGSSSTEIASWLENNVFCLVSNEDESHYELHIWNDTQRKVVSIENYFTVLNSMFAETGNISHDKFLKKVNEKYALIPEEVVKYFINNVTKKPKFKVTVQNKENKVYGCKVISYEYLKKRVVKKRILTEIFDKSNGKVLQSRCHEEDPLEEDVFYVEKTEKLSDITNTKFTEVSSTTYSSNQALEIKYLGKTSVAYLPPGEINNQDHLVALSNVIYSVNDFPENTGDIQLEFVIPQKQPTKVFSEIESLLSLIEKTDSGSKPTEPKTLVKTPKKNTDTKTRPNMVITPPGKLAIVANPKTRGATLKHLFNEPLISESKIPSYSELNAAAATDIVETAMEEDDDNDDDDDDDDNGHDFLENVDDLFEDSAAPEVPAQVAVKKLNVDEKMVRASDTDNKINKRETICPDTSDRSREVTNIQTKPLELSDVHDHEPTINSTKDNKTNDSNKVMEDKTDENVDPKPRSKDSETVVSNPDINSIKLEEDRERLNQEPQPEVDKEHSQSQQSRRSSKKNMRKPVKLKKQKNEKVPEVRSHRLANKELVRYSENTEEGGGGEPSDPTEDSTENTKVEYHKCRTCSKKYKSKSGLHYHESLHKTKEMCLCQICGSEYANKQCLAQHVRIKHKNRMKKEFCCPVCSRVFSSTSGFRYHRLHHHSTESRVICETCGKELKNEMTYKKHVIDVHSTIKKKVVLLPCRLCDKVFRAPSSRKYHMETAHSGKKYTCDKCGVQRKSSVTLRNHIRLHETDCKVECTICGKAYQSMLTLKTHMNVHNGLAPYPCDQCDRTFPSSVRRQHHVRVAHTAKRFLCEICQKSFSNRTTFKYHVLTHTGEKPYPCSVCGKRFRSLDMIYIHKKTHSGVKDHICETCGQAFSQKGNLLRHVKARHP
ncbi:zinc finger protein 37 isoform X2 [Patella vulgata]|uniref:zinc finger protein 37 isoform X2 n=1 Tax=Patella vulgata TaxID=6465 RepID=UPI00217F8272|nr:zinc finger protein 37 isoform X2 [Patella vulgata]